ncbi:CHAT domain-containing protein [Nodularia sp. LEGE 04288]|uniref:CHAT domain-containing protein n=1 Tax=Nodularia sp. LEGE 04288 TaxID=1828639 RepID=UPI001D0FE90E|nr:CHAT domain-containing protein [Nodularia sp. LEGE 04288]MCC2695416.1 tetratricopeptide repeat protein [Nodularia sp. LEGE 04288]
MRYRKISATVFIGFILTTSVPVFTKLPSFLPMSPVLAQTPDARTAEADRLLQQGVEQFNISQFTEALQSWEQALQIYREIKHRLGEGNALGNLGLIYYSLGDYPTAIDYHQKSLAIAREIKDRSGEGAALGNLGAAYDSFGDYPTAINYHQQSLAIKREIKDRLGEGNALGNLGLTYYSLGDYPTAIDYHQQSLAIARSIKDRSGEGAALGSLGNAYDSLGDYPTAINYHQQSLAIKREIKDRLGEGKTLGNLGNAYDSLGDYPTAINYYQQSLAIAREIKDRRGEGAALGNLGNAYNNLGDYPTAINYLQQSLAIAREIKDRSGEGAALGNLGLAYDSLGDYPQAIDYHQQRLAIAREIKDRSGEGAALGNLGLAYDSLGDYPTALDYHQQRLAIARSIKDRRGEMNALGNLGNAYNHLGDYPTALDYLQQTLSIAIEIKNRRGEGNALGNLGNAYHSLGDYPTALDYHQQRLAIAREIKDRRGEGNALGNLGLTYYSLGDYPTAIDYLQQFLAIAREIKNRLGEGIALGNLGNAYHSLGDYPTAIDYHQQRLAISKKIKDRLGEGQSLNNLGFALYKQGNLSLAESTLLEGIKVYESLRGRELKDSEKVSIFETQHHTYNNLQKVLIAQNKTDAALEIAERGRGRAFVELLASRLSSESKQQFPTSPKIAEIQQIAKAQNATLIQYSITHEDFQIQGKSQSKESELYIWVIKPTGEVNFRKADLKSLWEKENTTLAELVTTSRQSIGVRGRGIKVTAVPDASKAKQKLLRLHELLIEPIADLLPKKETERVVFVPQSQLFLVPFPALQDDKGKYLIEKHTILSAPSIQVLDLTRQQRIGKSGVGKGKVLVVGNPTMPKVVLEPGKPSQQLSNLEWAEKEAKGIASLFKTEAFTGNQATKAAIVQQMIPARIIHLATHGIFDDLRGLGSAIALAPSGEDKGLLTAEEIFDMKLNAELVVLSACDTGRGRLTGDGVIGLSRSLISAGVPSVIVSLWAVDDNSTSVLMTEFYKNLQQNVDKATSLRNAMLTTMKTHPSPKYWAAFTLIGESE